MAAAPRPPRTPVLRPHVAAWLRIAAGLILATVAVLAWWLAISTGWSVDYAALGAHAAPMCSSAAHRRRFSGPALCPQHLGRAPDRRGHRAHD